MTPDERILQALSMRPLTALQAATVTGILPSDVRLAMRRLKYGGQIEAMGQRSNPAVWAIKRPEDTSQSGANANGRCNSPMLYRAFWAGQSQGGGRLEHE